MEAARRVAVAGVTGAIRGQAVAGRRAPAGVLTGPARAGLEVAGITRAGAPGALATGGAPRAAATTGTRARDRPGTVDHAGKACAARASAASGRGPDPRGVAGRHAATAMAMETPGDRAAPLPGRVR